VSSRFTDPGSASELFVGIGVSLVGFSESKWIETTSARL
jgi:hypothetical protein